MNNTTVPRRVLRVGWPVAGVLVVLTAANAGEPPAAASQVQVVEREGVRIEMSAVPAAAQAPVALPALPPGETASEVEAAPLELREAEYADISFRITDLQSGRPVTGLYPAAWMDLAARDEAEGGARLGCREKIGLYAKGSMSFRPMLDLNAYFVLAMNRDSSISVLDPILSLAGLTSTYGMLYLRSPGADWAYEPRQERLFVSMPNVGQVAVFDMRTLKLAANIEVGGRPVRVALEPDGRRLWIGDDAPAPRGNGVVVMDTERLDIVARIATGAGHHDLAITPDGDTVLVTNLSDRTLSVIDAERLEVVAQVDTGGEPVSVATARASMTAVVAARDGMVTVLDLQSRQPRTRLERAPGLRMVRFSPDERWVFLVNTDTSRIDILDAATDRVRHTVTVDPGPDQVNFTPAYAYIRSLGSPNISMIQLEGLERDEVPPVLRFPAGVSEPGRSSRLGISSAVTMTNKRHSVLVANPTSELIFYYMEGMNAPMGSFRNFGHNATTVAIVDRSVREQAPGHYTARVRVPTAGEYDVALLLDTPRMTHCFSLNVEENPLLAQQHGPRYKVSYVDPPQWVDTGTEFRLRFRLVRESRRVVEPVDDTVMVLSYFNAAGHDRRTVVAEAAGDGFYEASLSLSQPGAYYIFAQSPALGIQPHELSSIVIRTRDPRRSP